MKMRSKRNNKLKTIILTALTFCITTSQVFSRQASEVSITYEKKPKIEIALAKENTELNTDNFENNLKEQLSNLGVDSSDVIVQTIEPITNKITSQTLDADNITKSWETVGAKTWQSSNGQIVSLTHGGKEKPSYWGTALINPKGYDSEMYKSSFTMVTGGQLNEGVCFNVTKNEDGSLNGYFISMSNHTSSSCALFRFDHYTLDQAFDSGINNIMSCGPHNNGWNLGQTYTYENDSYTVLARWETASENVKYDVSYENGDIVIKTNNAQVASVHDETYPKGTYGFWGNNCELDSYMHIADIDITTQEKRVKNFEELLRDTKWSDSSSRFITYVSDTTNEGIQNELLTRLINEGVHFIGWGNNDNKEELKEIIELNNNQGIYISNKNYESAIEKTAKYIKEKISELNKNDYILLNEPIKVTSEPEGILTGTADEEWESGKWRINHDFEYFDNNLGQLANSGKYTSDFITTFDKVGKYDLTYMDESISPASIYVHRKPVAQFTIERRENTLNYVDKSFDLDKREGEDNGIEEREWKWLDTSENVWHEGQLKEIDTSKEYIIQLKVKDHQNTWSDPVSKYITSNSNSAPIAMFELENDHVSKYENIKVTNTSYDPAGNEITSTKWEVYKDGDKIYEGNTPKLNYITEGLGEYTIYLTVTNSQGITSEGVSKRFEIINDVLAPEVSFSTSGCEWKQRETVGVKVVDKGGSGFKSFKYAITDTQEEPSSWNEDIMQPDTNITLDKDGVQYIHVKTKDIDGNESPDRVVGPFKIDNSNPTVQVSGNLETETTEPINISIETEDTLSGVKQVSVNGDVLPNEDNNVYRITKNGTYVIKVEDNAGNSYEYNLEVTNVYTRCDTELGHPRYSTSSKDCPICNLIEGVHVTNDEVTYNSQEQSISYENRKDAQLVEYYNGEKAKPVDVGTYQYELKIEYEGTEYQTGIKGQFEIEQKEVTVSGLKPQNREYDGTKVIKVTEGNLVGVEEADKESVGFTLPQNGIVDSKNVGSYKVTIPEIVLNGERANNYKITIPTEELNVTISPKTVLKDEQGNPTTEKVRIIGFLGKSREYNGTNEIELSKGEIVGIEECDKEKVDYIVPSKATIPDKNIGTYKVTIPEIKLVGEEAQNYVLSQPSGDEIELNIVPKKITISKIEAKDKVYDGSNAIELTGGELSGVEQTDIDRIKFILVKTGRTSSYDAGEYNVEVPEIKLAGTAARNYTLEQPKEGEVKVTISKKDITVEGVTAVDRAYNATNEVELIRGNLVGVLEQDQGKVDYILPEAGIISNKNIGTHGVHVPEIKLTGEKAQNYNIIQIKDDEIKVEISKKDITLSEIKAESRQYDGTNVVNILSANLEGVEAPDEKKVKIDLPETGTIASKNVGNYYVEIEDVLLNESESPNYNLIQPGEKDIPVEIYERELTIAGIKGENRKWNNTNVVNIIPGELKNVINGDDVNITVPRTGTIEDNSSGIHEVTIEPIELYGDDVANYTLIQPSAEDILVSIYRPEKPEFELQPNIISVNGDTNAQEIRYGDEVEIRLNIENRGSGIGYAQKITNIVPEGLMLVENNPVNKQYGWKQNGNKIETQIASKTSENENAIEPTANKEVLLVLEITAKEPLSESLDDLIKVLVTDIEGNPLNMAEIEDSKTPTPEAPETNKKTFTIKRYVYIHKTLKDIKAERKTDEKGQEYAVANLETSEDVKITEGKKEYIAKPRGWSRSKEPDAEIEVKINEEATVTGLERYYLSYEYERQIPYVKADGTVGYLSQHVDMAYDGTKKAGKVTIPTEDTKVPEDLEKEGWEQEKGTGKEEPGNGVEEGKDIWTTDPEHPDDPSKWVDPEDPDTDLDDNETIQPVFKKLVTATRVVYLNQELGSESKYTYRCIEDDTVVPATFELGTSDEVEVNDHIAKPKHWKSTSTGENSTEELNELIVKINGVAHLTEDTRYDLIYKYTQKYSYTKPDGSQGEGEQEVEVKPDGTEDKGEVKVPAEDDVVPEDLEKEGWEREKGTGKEKPGNGIEEGHNVWTTDPEHPDDSSKWVDPKDPESGIDPNVPIHPVYKKLVSALRYVYLNQELEPLSEYAYRSFEEDTIVKAKINLGTTEPVIVKGCEATPKYWSTNPAPDVTEPKVELNGEVEIAENTAYYMSYHTTREVTYVKPDGTEGKASQEVDVGYDGKEKGGEVQIPEEDKKVPEELEKEGWEEEKKPSKEEPTPPSGGGEDHKVWTTDPEDPGDPDKWVDPEDPDNPVDPQTPIYPVYKKEMTAKRHVYLNREIDELKGFVYRSVEGSGITPAEIEIGTTDKALIKNKLAEPRYWSQDSTYDAPEPNNEETVDETSVALEGTVHITKNTDYYMTYLYTEDITYAKPDGSDGKAKRDTVAAWDGSEKNLPIEIEEEKIPEDLKKDGWEENRGDGKDGGNGRDQNGGKDNNGDGIPDSWDTDGDGRDDAWDTDVPPDGNADSWDENDNDKLDKEEDNSKTDHDKRDKNGGTDTNGDGRPDAWDRNGDGKNDSWDKDGDGNADTYDRNWNGELEDSEDNSKHPEELKGRDENGGKDTNKDGKPDVWDTDGDGKDDAWDTDVPPDGNADSYDKDGDGELDDDEDNSKHPENDGRDENGGKDTNGDGKPDTWDRDGDGKDDAKDTDGDGNADSYDKDHNGKIDDDEDNSKHPENGGRDENGGKDTNGDGKPDTWDRDGDGKDDAKDTDGDGNADSFDKDHNGEIDESEDNSKHPENGGKDENNGKDTNGDGKPDTWDRDGDGKDDAKDTDGDGNADSFDKDHNGEIDESEDNSKHPENGGRDENGGKDTNGDGRPDTWDRDGDGRDDSKDTDGDGNADSFDKDHNGEIDESEDNSKHPENGGKDENNGKDTNGDGRPDTWDRDGDGKDDAKDTDGDGNADSFDKDHNGEIDDDEDNSKHPENGGRDENGGKDTNGDGRPDTWDRDGDGKDDAKDTDGDGNADSYDKDHNGKIDNDEDNSKHPENGGRDENGGKDTNKDGKPDTWDRNGDGNDDSWDKDGDGNADTYDRNWNGELEDSEDNSKHPEELKGRDENNGKDTNGDGKPDLWDRNDDGEDDSKDTDGDGNADMWKNDGSDKWTEEDESGYRAWDTNKDGKPDAWDTDNDGNADTWDKNDNNEPDPEEQTEDGRDPDDGGRDTNGDGKKDAWDTDGDGEDDAWDTDVPPDEKPDAWDKNKDGKKDEWDTNGDGKPDAWDTDVPPDGNADSYDRDGDGELDDNEDNSKHPDELKGRDQNGGEDTNGDGRPDAWDRNGDDKNDSWDKDGDGNADTYDRNWNGELEDSEDNSKHPDELKGRDENGGKDTNKDGRPDTWDRDGDGKDDAWDTDVPPDGNADSYDKDGDGELDDNEDNSKHPELDGRDKNGGKDTNGDGKPDTWDRDGDGKDDAWDTDVPPDGNADSYDKDGDGELDDDEDNSKHPDELKGRDQNGGKDTNGDGRPDTWDRDSDGKDDSKDTDGDGNADSYDKDHNGEIDDDEDNSKHPENGGRDENGGKDTNGDGRPDTWDRDGDGKDDAWDTDVPPDGNADSYDRNGNGKLDDDEDNSKHPEDLKGRDENNGKDTNGDGKPDTWDRDGDGRDDSKDTDGDGNADSFDKDHNGEIDESEDNSKHPENNGRDENGGKDTNGDGRPDTWDRDGDGKDDSKDTDGDGNADSYDKDHNGKIDDEEDNSKHPENGGRDENNGKDTNGDGKPDTWDRDGDGKDDSKDTDGDGNADSYDKDHNGEIDESEDNSKHPENNGRDENGGKDTNKDGRPDTWDNNGDGDDDSEDTDGDGNADKWKDPETGEWKDEDKSGNKAWDIDGDGKPDSWDTDGDGNADSYDTNGNGELDDAEDNSKHPDELKGRDQNGGKDTNKDGKPDTWDIDGDGKDDSWDTDKDGNADSYDRDGDGKLDNNENFSKHPELDAKDPNGGRDTNKDGRPDSWDRNNDGKYDSWDKDGDGNADSYDRNWDGKLEDEEDYTKHPELNARDEHNGKDTNKDGKPDIWDRNHDGTDDSRDTDNNGCADQWKVGGNEEWTNEDETGYRAWDTNKDGKPDAWDTNGDGKADSFDANNNNQLDPEEDNSKKESNGFEEGHDIYTTDPDHPEDQSKWVDPLDPDADIDPSQKLYPVNSKTITVVRYIYPDNIRKYPELSAKIYSCKKDWETTIISSHTFNLGTTESITIDGVNASPYKWVEDITVLNNFKDGEDLEGVEPNGEITTNEDKEYYMVYKLEEKDIYVGPNNENKNIDDVDPEIKFDPHGKSIYAKEQKVTINVTDNKELDTSSFKYKWVQGNTEVEPAEEEFTQSFTNNEPITQDGLTGTDWYLWAMAKDVNGNKKVARTDAFFFDNTVPTTTKPEVTDTKVDEIKVETRQEDYESGLNPLLHQYAIKEASSEEWREWKTAQNESYTFTDLKHSTEYNIKTRATDSVGNSSESEVITVYTVGLAKPSIQFNPEHWTNGEVEVTISYPEIEDVNLAKQYSFNGSDWISYDDKIKVQNNNTKIYARSLGSNNLGEDVVAERTVTNIDNTIPNIKSVNTTDLQPDGKIHLTAEVIDSESGIIAYQFSQNDNITYDSPDGWVPVENKPEVGGITDTLNLERKVVETGIWYLYVKDDAGNLAKGQVEVLESAYDVMTPTITYTPQEWYFVKDAQIDYPEIEGMQIFYGINNQDDMRPYTRQTPLTIDINNTVIYAKTVINGKERFVSKTVEKIDTIAPTGEFEASKITTHNITATVNADDEGGSGLRDSDTYTYYINGQREVSTTSNSYTFDDLSQSSEYTLKVVIKDNAGNESTKEITVSTNTVPSLSSGGNINFGYDPGNGWTNTDVTVTMTTEGIDREEFTLQYLRDVGQADWEDYTDAGVIMQQNGAIYARLIDATGQTAGTATGNVRNIDKVEPGAVFYADIVNTHSIKVNVDAIDSGGSELRDTDTYSYYKDGTLMEKTTEPTYTFSNLKQNTDFNLKVEVRDNAGNVTTQEITNKTETVPELTMGANIEMEYTPTEWTATDVNVSLLGYAVPGFKLQYCIGTGNWYDYNEESGIVVERNNAIYARLVDETDQVGAVATGNITNIDKDKPTISSVTQSHNTDSITVNVSANDGKGSGLADEATYRYYKDGKLEETTTSSTHTFSNLLDYTNYDIKVEVVDNVGNMQESLNNYRTQCTGKHGYCNSFTTIYDYYCSVCNQCYSIQHYSCSSHRTSSHSKTSSGGTCQEVVSSTPAYYTCPSHGGSYTSSGTCPRSVPTTVYTCSECNQSQTTSFSHYKCPAHMEMPCLTYTSTNTCDRPTLCPSAKGVRWHTYPSSASLSMCELKGQFSRPSCGGASLHTLQIYCISCGQYSGVKLYACQYHMSDYLYANPTPSTWGHYVVCGKQRQNYVTSSTSSNPCGQSLKYVAGTSTKCLKSINTCTSTQDSHVGPCAAHGKTYAHDYCSHNSNGVPHD